jgi:hypothetical protein
METAASCCLCSRSCLLCLLCPLWDQVGCPHLRQSVASVPSGLTLLGPKADTAACGLAPTMAFSTDHHDGAAVDQWISHYVRHRDCGGRSQLRLITEPPLRSRTHMQGIQLHSSTAPIPYPACRCPPEPTTEGTTGFFPTAGALGRSSV